MLVLAVRAQEGRRRVTALREALFRRDPFGFSANFTNSGSPSSAVDTRSGRKSSNTNGEGGGVPKFLTSRTTQHSLRLLDAFFPATLYSVPSSSTEHFVVPLAPDPDFPIPPRGLACLPPTAPHQRRSPHTLAATR